MTLLLVNEDMYNFETVDDAFLWIQMHREHDDEVLILGDEDTDPDEVKAYLEYIAPIEVM